MTLTPEIISPLRIFGTTSAATLPIQEDFSKYVKKDQRMFLNDGLIQLTILSSKNGVITAKAKNSGWVTSNKGINLPETDLGNAAFTKKDREATEFAIRHKVEFIAQSFVQSAHDVARLRNILIEKKSNIKIVTKIEKPEAVRNIEEIIEASDSVIVARGDLAIETSAAEVPLIQHKIISLARQKQKPVIVATQMLESMIENPRPTRAEASDIANAVLSQVDAIMLSAESAVGKYPVQAVNTMVSIINMVENDNEFRRYIKINWEKLNINAIPHNAVVAASASLAYRLKSPVIAVGTVTGNTVRLLSSFRPSALVVAMTHDDYAARQLTLYWAIHSTVIPKTVNNGEFGNAILQSLRAQKIGKKGEKVVLVWGSQIGIPGTTNTIRVETI